MTNLTINFNSLLILFLINLIICTLGRRFLTYKGLQLILIFNSLLLLSFCTYFWKDFILNYRVDNFSFKLNPNTWTNIIYEMNFKIDNLSFLFIFLVIIIGFCTNIYILNYFKYEEREEEFMLLINWFIFSMIVLVSGNNFFTLILGWELIGLTSFLLINFWKFKFITLSCSFKAFCFNKFSDLFLMIFFCLLWNMFKINTIDVILITLEINPLYNNNMLIFSCICLLLCASIKSAQFIGHLWLPDSMEAPVPASSLIHSATLVSAGIYLILKFQILFILSNILNILIYLGSITACYGGLVAASQSDLKKILAYSTISHCGFIFVTLGLNNFVLTTIYLYLHGLFKAVTFFCAGSLIKYNNSQDTRLMGMLKNQLVNTLTIIFSSINLGGLPFTFGYLYKKIFLYETILSNVNIFNYGCLIMGLLSSVVYVYKLIYYSSFDIRKGYFQKFLISLQNYRKLINLNFFLYTNSHLISTTIIYIYCFFFFLILNYFVLKFYIIINYLPQYLTNELNFMYNIFFLKKYMISIFYSLFLLVIITLYLNNTRKNYFYLQNINLIVNIILFILFYNIINFFGKLLFVLVLI